MKLGNAETASESFISLIVSSPMYLNFSSQVLQDLVVRQAKL
jgi:hypothetical protein